MCGKIGAGKSTLSRQLAATPKTILVSEDDWLSRLYPDDIKNLSGYVRCTGRFREEAYEGLGDSYRSIFAAWLPASGCTLRNAPCFEKYLNRDPRRTKPENLRTEIWLPIHS